MTMIDGKATARPAPLRLFVFARHAESAANAGLVLNSDPSVPVPLTDLGRAQARALGVQLANVPIDLAVCSQMLRTRETVTIAMDGRQVPLAVEADFDEIRAGDFDGEPIEAYWAWLAQHSASDPLPHGESVNDALRRYAGALQRLLTRPELVTLVVLHEVALRHIAAAAAEVSPPGYDLEPPNAVPYLFDARALDRAATRLAASVSQARLTSFRGADDVLFAS